MEIGTATYIIFNGANSSYNPGCLAAGKYKVSTSNADLAQFPASRNSYLASTEVVRPRIDPFLKDKLNDHYLLYTGINCVETGTKVHHPL